MKTLIGYFKLFFFLIFIANLGFVDAQNSKELTKNDSTLALSLNGVIGGPISLGDLQKIDSLFVVNGKQQIIRQLQVVSFSFTTTKAGDIFVRKVKGNKFDEGIKKFINGKDLMVSGQKFWLEDIVIGNHKGETWKIRASSFVVK